MDTQISSKVQIYLSGRNLPRLGVLYRYLNPIIFMHVTDGRSSKKEYVGHTEVIRDSLNPDFKEELMLDYFFEENQIIELSLYHSESLDVSKDDKKQPPEKFLIGKLHFCLGDLVSSHQGVLTNNLLRGSGEVRNTAGEFSALISRCEIVEGLNDSILLQFEAVGLDKVHCWGKSSPILEIFRLQEDSSWQSVHRTEIVRRTTNPVWKPFKMQVHKLCNNDEKRALRLVVSDEKKSKLTLIGHCQTSLHELCAIASHADLGTVDESKEDNVPMSSTLFLTNPSAARKKGRRYKNSGFLLVNQAHRYEEAGFLDYILGGLNVGLTVAIDFTASNGDPQFSDSLHFLNSKTHTRNAYERAIRAIGSIVGAYDTDQKFPVWGFGAKLRKTGKVSQRFPLTFNEETDEVNGIEGIVRAYRQSFSEIQLSGPTMFSEIIDKASEIASAPFTEDSQHYEILLIITDGVVNDKMLTVKKIIDASVLPLSIIIVGVGNADFTDMTVLDGDDAILEQNGVKASRDIVQFVSMRNFRESETSRLATEVLAEVPHQVVSFMKTKNIKPGKRAKLGRTPSVLALSLASGSETHNTSTGGATSVSPVVQRALSLNKPQLLKSLQRARVSLQEKNKRASEGKASSKVVSPALERSLHCRSGSLRDIQNSHTSFTGTPRRRIQRTTDVNFTNMRSSSSSHNLLSGAAIR